MNEILARGLVTAKSSQIEGLLREVGAEGVGLRDLRSSVSDALDRETQMQIRYINRVRNEASHDKVFSIADAELEKFVATADSVIYKLQRKSLDKEADLVGSTTGHSTGPAISYRAATVKPHSNSSCDRKTLTLKSRQTNMAESCSSPDAAEAISSAKPDEDLIRDHQMEEQKSQQAAREMSLEGKARSRLSPETKEKIVSGAISVAAFVLKDIFKR